MRRFKIAVGLILTVGCSDVALAGCADRPEPGVDWQR
jgi:hypothetical protein